MDTAPPLLVARDARGVVTATLNRPELGNAYDGAMLDALIEGLGALAADASVRALVIRGAGRNFQTGANIHWLTAASRAEPEAALAASKQTTEAMRRLNEFPRPTLAVIQGACFGGGIGIACCVDVALCTPEATFGISEVRVGMVPTPISTHMVHALGYRQARRYAITGERFGSAEALRIGLVHEVVAAEGMEARLDAILAETLLSAPQGVAVAKASMQRAAGWLLDDRTVTELAHESWMQRASAEGQEGLAAFRDKRKPRWA